MSLIALVIEEDGWNDLPIAAIADRAARAALAVQALDPERFEIGLLACSDDRIAALNDKFRGKPVSTNVLSWPAEDLAPAKPGATPRLPQTKQNPTEQILSGGKSPKMPSQTDPDVTQKGGVNGDRVPLGDVAIALQTCKREAEAQSIPLKNHTTHLILHGCLHLLGFDHGREADAVLMEGVETRALGEMDIKDPHAPVCDSPVNKIGGRETNLRITGEAWATTVRRKQ